MEFSKTLSFFFNHKINAEDMKIKSKFIWLMITISLQKIRISSGVDRPVFCSIKKGGLPSIFLFPSINNLKPLNFTLLEFSGNKTYTNILKSCLRAPLTIK